MSFLKAASPLAGKAVWPRLVVLVIVVVILGLPINDFARFLLLTIAVMAVCFGHVRLRPKLLLTALAIALSINLIDAYFPGPRIEEGHNVYIPVGASLKIFEDGLPPDAHRIMLDLFNRAYRDAGAKLPGSPNWWNDPRFRRDGELIDRPFAPSSDALLTKPKYSRTVDRIQFRSQDQARIDAINDKRLNFYQRTKPRHQQSFATDARIERTAMPFFVMIEVNPAIVEGTICWRGDTLWEQDSGRYVLKHNNERGCSQISAEHLYKRIFSLAIAPNAPREFSVEPNFQQRVVFWSKLCLRLISVVFVLYLLVRPAPFRELLLPASAVLATILAAFIYWRDFVSGFRTHDGGNDGLTHESLGRGISQALARGDLSGAFRGGEDIFYYMPAMRYVRGLEDFLFGSTSFGVVLCTMFLPIFLYFLMRRMLSVRWCVVLITIFLFTPIFERFGFAQFLYVREMWKGFAEPIGYGAFLGALALIAANVPTRVGVASAGTMPTFWAGLALALSVAARPNLALACTLVLAMTAVWLTLERRWNELAFLAVGFAPVLLIPFHNWYFGGRFVPLTESAQIPANLKTPPSTYLAALSEIVRLEWSGPNLSRVAEHISRWNHLADFYRLPALLATFWVLCRQHYEISLRCLALVALSLQVTLFFYMPSGRYSHLAWLLVFLITVVAVQDDFVPWIRRRFLSDIFADGRKPAPSRGKLVMVPPRTPPSISNNSLRSPGAQN